MKVRNGFVSNSSSSSFILASKEPMAIMDRSEFTKALGIRENTPAAAIFGRVIDTMFSTKPITLESLLKQYHFASKEELLEACEDDDVLKQLANLLDEGWEVRRFKGSNEDYGPTAFFYYCEPAAVSTPMFRVIPL